MSISLPTAGALLRTQASGGGGSPSSTSRTALQAAATALMMTVDEVRKALASGATLASLALGRGMKAEAVTISIANALAQAHPGMSHERARQLANRYATNNDALGIGPDLRVNAQH